MRRYRTYINKYLLDNKYGWQQPQILSEFSQQLDQQFPIHISYTLSYFIITFFPSLNFTVPSIIELLSTISIVVD